MKVPIGAIVRTKRANGNANNIGRDDAPAVPTGDAAAGQPVAVGRALRTAVSGWMVGLRSAVCGSGRARRHCPLGAGLRPRACALALAALAPSFAGATLWPTPDPPWAVAEATERHVFTMPPEVRYSLVKLPATLRDGPPVARLVASVAGGRIPLRVLHAGARELAVMLNVAYVAAGTPVAIYAIGGAARAVPDADEPHDPAPIMGTVQRVVGQDLPATWEAHHFKRRRMSAPFHTFRATSFEHAQRESHPRQWRREDRRRPSHAIELLTWVRVDTPGTYRFAAQGADSVFLLWGEEELPVVEYIAPPPAGSEADDRDDPGPWRPGRSLALEPGIHPLRIVQVSRRTSNAQPGWIPPGATEVTAIPTDLLMSGAPPHLPLRHESRDKVVHAAFEGDIGPAYRFLGVPDTFAAVTLHARSANWLDDALGHRWTVDGVPAGAGATWTAVLRDGVRRIGLTSRNTLGFESTAERPLRIPSMARDEYRLAGTLHGVPSIGYDSDRVWPDLWLRGSAPESVFFDCLLTLTLRDGRTQTHRASVALVDSWAHLRGDATLVDGLAAIHWEIRHGGVLLARQNLRFVRPPFDILPDAVVGAELHAAGERLVLVVRRTAPEDVAPPTRMPAPKRIVLLDSTLAPPGWYEGAEATPFHAVLAELLSNGNGAPAPVVERVGYETLVADTEGALRTLAPLAGLRRFARDDLIVVALGLEAYVDREPPGAFERRLAGLCALLRETLGADVLLVTPPPLGDDRAAMRPYAEAVLRVADAYGLVAADVYSAFGGHAWPQRLHQGLRITQEGQALAAGTIVRAVRRGR